MSNKTLGQVAYEIFHRQRFPGDRYAWESDKHEHVAWQAAAEAVLNEAGAHFRTISPREYAVIEAAKALVYTGGVSEACAEGAVDRLTKTIEALEEVESDHD